jgi:hypothetical protein
MTRKERVDAEIRITFDLIRHFIAHPEDLDAIPDGAYVDVISSDHVPLPVPEGATRVLFVASRTFRRLHPAA